MSLLQISTAPRTPAEWLEWSFSHQANHQDTARVVFKTKGVRVNVPPLDPIEQTTSWLYNHQQLHADVNKALGIQGQNLLLVDWSDEESVLDWVLANFDDHQRQCTVLNLG